MFIYTNGKTPRLMSATVIWCVMKDTFDRHSKNQIDEEKK